MTFAEKVVAVVKRIPRGKTLSYKEVAARAGAPNAARAVGTIMSKNHDPKVPCHRVIKSDGSPGGYNGFMGEKARLLREDGAI
jgi:methylated-DNA-[protein]-cysteine S-methyltransferase